MTVSRARRLACLLAPLLATPGLAATNAAKNRCADAVRILRQQGSMPYQTQDVDPLHVDAVEGHLAQVKESWDRAAAQIKQIPKGELVRDDPELKECWDTLQAWGDYLVLIQVKMKQAAKVSASLGPFMEKTRGKERSMLTLAAVELDPGADVLGNSSGAQVRALLAELAEVARACEALGPGVGEGPLQHTEASMGVVTQIGRLSFGQAFKGSAHNWCHVARNRQALAAAAAGNRYVPVEGYRNYAILVPEAVEKLSVNRPELEAWLVEVLRDKAGFLRKRQQAAAAWNREAGLGGDARAGIGEQLDRLQARVDEVAAQVPPPVGEYHDGRLEGLARTSLGRLFPDASVRGAFMDSDRWTVEKNALGVPLDRFRSGQLVFKRPALGWCESRTFSYTETYTGGGHFAPAPAVNLLGSVTLSRCP